MPTHQLPDYYLRALHRHIAALLPHVNDAADHRVAESLRLMRQDLKKLDRILRAKPPP